MTISDMIKEMRERAEDKRCMARANAQAFNTPLDETAGRFEDEAASTIEALAEALEPFAKCAATFDAYMSGSDSIRLSINCADLRRARSALNLLKGEGVTAQPPTDGGSDAG